MRLQRIAEEIYHKPWFITPSAHAAVRRLFEAKLARTLGDDGTDPANPDGLKDNPFYVQRSPARLDENQIGHVQILGVTGLGLSRIEKTCGNTDTQDVACELKQLAQDGARGILLCINSPGGLVTGTPELADVVSTMEIPVVVYVDNMCASAAYFAAAGADKIVATESAEIGSIGTLIPWQDTSGLEEKVGVVSDPIINSEGTYKGIFFSSSLSDEHRTYLQAEVDRKFGVFKSFVTQMRQVPDDACHGQMFMGIDALAVGLIDQVGGL